MDKKLVRVKYSDLFSAGVAAKHNYPQHSALIDSYLDLRKNWEAGIINDSEFSKSRLLIQKEFKKAGLPWRIWFKKNGHKVSGTVCPCCMRNTATITRPMILRWCFGVLYPVKVCPECNPHLRDFDVLKYCLPMNRWKQAAKYVYGMSVPRLDGKLFSPVIVTDVLAHRGSMKEFRNKGGHKIKIDKSIAEKYVDPALEVESKITKKH